jgi:hypothetical protein
MWMMQLTWRTEFGNSTLTHTQTVATLLTFGEASCKQEMSSGNYFNLPETITKYALLHINGNCVDTLFTTLLLPWPYAYSPMPFKSVWLTADWTTRVSLLPMVPCSFIFSTTTQKCQHPRTSFHRRLKVFTPLECCVVTVGGPLPTFRYTVSVPSSG